MKGKETKKYTIEMIFSETKKKKRKGMKKLQTFDYLFIFLYSFSQLQSVHELFDHVGVCLWTRAQD